MERGKKEKALRIKKDTLLKSSIVILSLVLIASLWTSGFGLGGQLREML